MPTPDRTFAFNFRHELVPTRSYAPVQAQSGWSGTVLGVAGFLVAAVIIIGGLSLAMNGGTFACDKNCWTAKTLIAAVVSNANAGMGNNTTDQGVNAVRPAVNLPPVPAQPVVIAPPQQRVIVPPPAPLATCATCSGQRWAQVTSCLARLGVAPGEVRSVLGNDGHHHAILTPNAKARLQANGTLGAAAACARG